MEIPPEFFVPHNTCDLDDPLKKTSGQYFIDAVCEFDVPSQQQLDDLTRLFDQLHREKSPTAIFSKQELFVPLYSYMKGITGRTSLEIVNKFARHKICHEVSERMKKLLQVCAMFLRKRTSEESSTEALKLCLRSTLKMYCYIICTILATSAPKSEETEESSQRTATRRKRRRETDSGFGDDDSGVDLDGRELALNSLIEMLSDETVFLWPNNTLEGTTLNLVFRMCLHMITQKSNISGDAQCISSALSLLLARVLNWMSVSMTIETQDLTFPLIDVSLKSESAVNFLSKLVSDIEESGNTTAKDVLQSIFESMSNAALTDAINDPSVAKNISIFFGEVSRKSVSVTQKFSSYVQTILQSESYDIRKGAITSIVELIVQKFSGAVKDSCDDRERSKYLNELIFRVMDVNPFVRNHTLHMWDKLIESKAVPRTFYIPLTEAVVGRLEDKSYLVRGSAMSCVSSIVKKMWFGQVLNSSVLKTKYTESLATAQSLFPSDDELKLAIHSFKAEKTPQSESESLLGGAEETSCAPATFTPEQTSALSKLFFYECAQKFIVLVKKATYHATLLLDSKTERDVTESIQLIVTAADCRLDDVESACLKMIVLVFHTEVKIQMTVRDAFAEIIFSCFNSRVSVPQLTRTTASAQKLIIFLRGAREGEISAIERIFALLKLSPNLSRHLSDQFMDTMWNIAEGSLDSEISPDDCRMAMRIYSILSKFLVRNVRDRRDRILEFLRSEGPKDNMLVTHIFKALENESKDPHFKPIPMTENPLENCVLSEIIRHLCRRTTALASWMCLASAGINAINSICEVPVLVYGYVLQYLQQCTNNSRDENTRAQLCFLVGCTALKQLIAVETAERKQMKVLEEGGSSTNGHENLPGQCDSMQKDLGLGSLEYRRHAIQELTQLRKLAILDQDSLWSGLAQVVVDTVTETAGFKTSLERVCAVVALCQLMVVSEKFCSDHLQLLFEIVSQRGEHWVVKTNIVIALGDLACVHPNILAPFLSHPTTGLFKLLKEDDLRVRAVTIQVCSHLVLGEMLRIKEHLFTIVKLVADPDPTIAQNAVTFIQNLALKEKERTGNLIPPLITKLNDMPQEKFRLAMRTLLERVEGDKPTESLIDRLCQRFESYNEHSKKKRILAENIAFCLSELNYSSERVLKKLMSEQCYQQYKLWLRKHAVLDFFKSIIAKSKKNSRGGTGNRDMVSVEEWEARIMADCSAVSS